MKFLSSIESFLKLHKTINKHGNTFVLVLSNIGEVKYRFGNEKIKISKEILGKKHFYSKRRLFEFNSMKFVSSPIFGCENELRGFVILGVEDSVATLYLWESLAELLSYLISIEWDFSNLIEGDRTLNEYVLKRDLTSREKEVVFHLKYGMTDYDIAQKLCLSTPTIRKHLNSIYKKSGVESKPEFIANYYLNIIRESY